MYVRGLGARTAQSPSWGIPGTGSILGEEQFCIPEHFKNPDRHRQKRRPRGCWPRTQASEGQGHSVGHSGMFQAERVDPGCFRCASKAPGCVWVSMVCWASVCFGCPEAERPGGPAGREHKALSALTKPLCVAQGVGCGSLACGQEQRSQHLHRGPVRVGGCKAFPPWTHPGLLIPIRLGSQPRLSLQPSSFPYSQ